VISGVRVGVELSVSRLRMGNQARQVLHGSAKKAKQQQEQGQAGQFKRAAGNTG
jgi:hypothetical protein